jgi:acyl-CoA synthetase (AMP-forming)/AMP-acid ligase II
MTDLATFALGDLEDPRGDLVWGTIPALVDWAAARFGEQEAVVDGDVRLSFAGLADRVDEVARGLVAAGLMPGDRVALWAPNCHEWILGALGALRAGGVIVTLNTRFKGSEAAYILRTSGASILLSVRGFLGFDYPAMLVDHDCGALRSLVLLRGEARGPAPANLSVTTFADVLAQAPTVGSDVIAERLAAIDAETTSDLIFTSGTTGNPKGVMTSHGQTLRTFATWASIVGLRQRDRYLVVNPFFHTFGYKAGLLASLMAGATIIPEAVFDVDLVLDRIDAERVSMLPGPPTLYQSILTHPRRSEVDLSSLRLGVTGAAVVPVELVVAMRDELGFETVLTAYGLTESCGVVSMCRRNDAAEIIATTSGRAIPDVEVRTVGSDGTGCEPGEPGEILVRGYPVMQGYFGLPDATAEAIDAEGWLHTGDIGTMDAAGNIVITDRLKDMYVVGGFNAYPAEIEAVLRTVPGVADLAVVGIPDDRMGEVGCAYVVRDPDDQRDDEALRDALITAAREKMANYKAPRAVVFVDELPRNASGKVLKRQLREQHVLET